MSVRLIPKAEGHMVMPNGTWHQLHDGFAVVKCLECGNAGYLDDHTIATDGTVTPSLDCPMPLCSFHEFVKLDGWEA